MNLSRPIPGWLVGLILLVTVWVLVVFPIIMLLRHPSPAYVLNQYTQPASTSAAQPWEDLDIDIGSKKPKKQYVYVPVPVNPASKPTSSTAVTAPAPAKTPVPTAAPKPKVSLTKQTTASTPVTPAPRNTFSSSSYNSSRYSSSSSNFSKSTSSRR